MNNQLASLTGIMCKKTVSHMYYTSYYHQASPQTSVFKVDGDFSLYDAYLYEIKENSNGDWVLSSLQQNVSGTYNAGVTSYSIPSVTDIPRIIHFQK